MFIVKPNAEKMSKRARCGPYFRPHTNQCIRMIWYCIWGKWYTHQRKVCDKATTKGAKLRKWWGFGELWKYDIL